MGIDECSTTEGLEALIEKILCSSTTPLESIEILEKVAEICGREPTRVLFRRALASLVKSGRVERISGEEYGKARVLFKCKG